MRRHMKRLRIALPIAIGATVVALTLLLLYSEPLRMAILEPATWMIDDVRRSLATVPQGLLWAIGLLIGIGVLAASWKRVLTALTAKPRISRRSIVRPYNANAIATLTRDLDRAAKHHSSRARIVRELAILAIRLIAKREGISVEEARKLVVAGRWPDDRRVKQLFASRRAGANRTPKQSFVDAVEYALAYLVRYYQEV
jgi:hypothetical protein